MCFSVWRKDQLSTTGVDYNELNTRLGEKISRHEAAKFHTHAVEKYISLSSQDSDIEQLDGATEKEVSTRNYAKESVECIIKIIIYIATHGKSDNFISCLL